MPHPARRPFTKAEALSLSAALTILAAVLPSSGYLYDLHQQHLTSVPGISRYYHRFADLCLIAIGLMLTLPVPRESGLLCALVYPRLPEHPFQGSDLSIWLTSPLAQDLIFGGVIYRLLRPHFSGRVVRWLPFEWALPVGGLFFAAWHLQNLAYMSAAYVGFQMLYTWAGFTVVGLTRQWTGSLLYVTLAHMAGNFVPWYVD